eukprot:COSAG04_NODE_24066_length_327_cov_1.771930_1_plen_39_part_10
MRDVVMMLWAAAPLQQRQEPQHRLPAPELGPAACAAVAC